MRPPTPSTSRVTPIRSGATSWTERAKKSRPSSVKRAVLCLPASRSSRARAARGGRGRRGRRGPPRRPPRGAAGVAGVDGPPPAGGREPLGQIERIVENRAHERRVLAHLGEDRPL